LFAAIPEREWVAWGAFLGLAPTERRWAVALEDATLAAADVLADPTRTVVDGWFVDRGHYRYAAPPAPGRIR
jgi:hypothetical protein